MGGGGLWNKFAHSAKQVAEDIVVRQGPSVSHDSCKRVMSECVFSHMSVIKRLERAESAGSTSRMAVCSVQFRSSLLCSLAAQLAFAPSAGSSVVFRDQSV